MSKTQIVSGGITDGTIATADIADDAVTADKATGILGFTVAEFWTLISNSSTTSTTSGTFTSPSFYDGITGSAQMTQSSGVFTFPSTGYYFINFIMNVYDDGEDHRQVANFIKLSTNSGSDYATSAQGNVFIEHTSQGSNTHASVSTQVILDIANTSTHKLKFDYFFTNSSLTFYGDNRGVTAYFQKLGET
jgi:hypothetical protein